MVDKGEKLRNKRKKKLMLKKFQNVSTLYNAN